MPDKNRGPVNRPGAGSVLLRALISGTVASFTTSAALVLLAQAEGKGTLQPLNATSHWLHGPKAAEVRDADLRHTAVGYGTHHLSCIFWALPFEWWLSSRKERTAVEAVCGASAVSAIAAVVDYGIVPRRLTPGWEHAVSPRAIAATFGALALGLAAGGLVTAILCRRS